jgi:diacylglycerol kinase family enzyme
LNAAVKSRMGMSAYYAKATHLWLTHKMQFFEAEYLDCQTGEATRERVTELLAVRIAQFGGVLRKFAPAASLTHDDHRLVLFKTANRLLYLAFIFRGLIGAKWKIPNVEVRSAPTVACRRAHADGGNLERIYVEADGELVGTLPAEISIVRDAFILLVPPEFARRRPLRRSLWL